jgi:2-haloalkanoic acid dehalogenase type II
VTGPKPRAVLFDLLTALLDSWSLWDEVAGDAALGHRWRLAYLQITYGEGRYRPYTALVGAAAAACGLPASATERLAAGYPRLQPWPEAPGTLAALSGRVRLGIVTNCSEELAQVAAARVDARFDAVVSAERAGWYKPSPVPYLMALDALGVRADETLFVAGSAYDLFGAAAVGMKVFWHDRIGMAMPDAAPPPLARRDTLSSLPEFVLPNKPQISRALPTGRR